MDANQGLIRTEAPYFTYRARPERVLAADTIDLVIDLGFGIAHHCRVDLWAVEAHPVQGSEESDADIEKGRAEAKFVAEWMKIAVTEWDGTWPLAVETLRPDEGAHGPFFATIFRRSTGRCLNDDLRVEFPDVAR